MLNKGGKLVYGVGINDADYKTHMYQQDAPSKKQKLVWICPFYQRWKSMLERCYSEKYQARQPTYVGCSVSKDWLSLSNFKSWMEKQDWEGKQLDKDVLLFGNKVYSNETCVFVSRKVNTFLAESTKSRGEWPIGVYSRNGKFRAQCKRIDGSTVYLGIFDNSLDAHKSWLAFKLEQSYILAAQQTDERVAKALIERYENYQGCNPSDSELLN